MQNEHYYTINDKFCPSVTLPNNIKFFFNISLIKITLQLDYTQINRNGIKAINVIPTNR